MLLLQHAHRKELVRDGGGGDGDGGGGDSGDSSDSESEDEDDSEVFFLKYQYHQT